MSTGPAPETTPESAAMRQLPRHHARTAAISALLGWQEQVWGDMLSAASEALGAPVKVIVLDAAPAPGDVGAGHDGDHFVEACQGCLPGEVCSGCELERSDTFLGEAELFMVDLRGEGASATLVAPTEGDESQDAHQGWATLVDTWCQLRELVQMTYALELPAALVVDVEERLIFGFDPFEPSEEMDRDIDGEIDSDDDEMDMSVEPDDEEDEEEWLVPVPDAVLLLASDPADVDPFDALFEEDVVVAPQERLGELLDRYDFELPV